jgi:hypothetical protein
MQEVGVTVHYPDSTELKEHQPDPTTQQRPVQPSPVIPTNEARQGVTGHNVRYVLGIGVAAIVVIFAGLWLYYFA